MHFQFTQTQESQPAKLSSPGAELQDKILAAVNSPDTLWIAPKNPDRAWACLNGAECYFSEGKIGVGSAWYKLGNEAIDPQVVSQKIRDAQSAQQNPLSHAINILSNHDNLPAGCLKINAEQISIILEALQSKNWLELQESWSNKECYAHDNTYYKFSIKFFVSESGNLVNLCQENKPRVLSNSAREDVTLTVNLEPVSGYSWQEARKIDNEFYGALHRPLPMVNYKEETVKNIAAHLNLALIVQEALKVKQDFIPSLQQDAAREKYLLAAINASKKDLNSELMQSHMWTRDEIVSGCLTPILTDLRYICHHDQKKHLSKYTSEFNGVHVTLFLDRDSGASALTFKKEGMRDIVISENSGLSRIFLDAVARRFKLAYDETQLRT